MSSLEEVLVDLQEMGPAWFGRELALDVLLWLITRVEPARNRCLAQRLHRLADTYDTRPTGEWK